MPIYSIHRHIAIHRANKPTFYILVIVIFNGIMNLKFNV